MTTAPFDPYHRWLGIPPKQQPPNHYRLLGLDLFESDPEVINDAAVRQSAHVRLYQISRHSDLSQRLITELTQAQLCLRNPLEKEAYDERLRLSGQATDAESHSTISSQPVRGATTFPVVAAECA